MWLVYSSKMTYRILQLQNCGKTAQKLSLIENRKRCDNVTIHLYRRFITFIYHKYKFRYHNNSCFSINQKLAKRGFIPFPIVNNTLIAEWKIKCDDTNAIPASTLCFMNAIRYNSKLYKLFSFLQKLLHSCQLYTGYSLAYTLYSFHTIDLISLI